MKEKMLEKLEKHIPIAQEFHKSEPVTDEDLLAPKRVLLPFNAFLLFSQFLVFIIMIVYYSDPVNYISESKLQIRWDWGKTGDKTHSTPFNCTPVQSDEYWAHEFGYDTCKLYARKPSETTVVESTKDVGGINYTGWYYKPYEFSDTYMNLHTNMFSHRYLGTSTVAANVEQFLGDARDPCQGNWDFAFHREGAQLSKGYLISKTGIPHDSIADRDAGCEITKEQAIARFGGYYDTISTVAADAAAQTTVAGWEPTDLVCAYAKANIPFACERAYPKPAMEILSLSYSNSLFLYSVFSAVLVQIFFSSASLFTKKEDANKESNTV